VTYIIAEPCIGTKDTACVDVCPVDCIHPAKGRTYDDGRPTFDEVHSSRLGRVLQERTQLWSQRALAPILL
jgi:NAD-dependent dihydropyrimidine dehydrogenase PreA subunit